MIWEEAVMADALSLESSVARIGVSLAYLSTL
jgi:hypothetical protein